MSETNSPTTQPDNASQQQPPHRPYLQASVLAALLVGILAGIAGYHYLQGNLQQITHILITAAYIAFGAIVLSFIAMLAFRENLSRSIFGLNAQRTGTAIQDAQKAADYLTDQVTGYVLRHAPQDIQEGTRAMLPRLLNVFFWGRIRNWWWQWIIGLFAAIGGLTGTVLLMNQNILIQRQMFLEEANRRSALVVLMSNIMDKVDREIEKQQDLLPKEKRDSARFQLSQSLIGQIAALSHSFKPYRYMSGDTLIPEPLSPERGQLLITLTLLPLDTVALDKIYQSAIFESADLKAATLIGVYLFEADLRGADLRGADLFGADLRGAYLSRSSLSYADLRFARLNRADLNRADLNYADLSRANLSYANLSYANLSYANLRSANLRSANLRSADLSEADLIRADLSEVDLNFDMLEQCFSLYEAKGLPKNISIQLKQKKSKLFEKPKY